jgi:ABC-type transporter Mla MlaB component
VANGAFSGGPRPVRLTVNADPQAPFMVHKRQVGGVQVLSVSGRLSESFQGARLGADLTGTVVLDLSGITRVTSFGVREWLQMLQEAESRVEGLYLARCSEAVSNQLSMIRRFAGKGQVVSFYAPYLCKGCGTAFSALLDCVEDGAAIKAEKPPEADCPRCGKPGVFDDDPRTYLTFGGQATQVPDVVRRAIATLDSDTAFESLEKAVDGDVTRVRVGNALDTSLRWTRVLEGVEGDVTIDLSGVPSTTGEGVVKMLESLDSLGHDVRAVKLEGVPASALDQVTREAASRPRLQVGSVRVEAHCASCNAMRPADVRLDGDLAALARGAVPEVACKRCHGPLSFDAALPLLKNAAKALQKRKAPPPRAAPVTAAAAAPAPFEAVARPSASLASSTPRMLAIGGLVLGGMVLAGGAAVVATRLSLAPAAVQAPPAAQPGSQAAGPGQVAAAAVDPAPADGWRTESGLQPGWADNPILVQGGSVWVVGRGTGTSEEEALAAARAEATDRLVGQMLTRLQGKPVHDLVETLGADAAGESASAVAQRYQKQLGASAALERMETAVKSQGDRREILARFRMPQDAFQSAVERYGKASAFQGVAVSAFFPALERSIRTEGDLVVVSSRAADVKPGDVVLAVGGRPVSTVEAFVRAAQQQWARLPSGGALPLQVERSGEAKTVRLVKR